MSVSAYWNPKHHCLLLDNTFNMNTPKRTCCVKSIKGDNIQQK